MGAFIEKRRGEPMLASEHPEYVRFFDNIQTDDLEDALALSSNTRFVEFLKQLCKPKFNKRTKTAYSVACVAKSCGITLPELNTFWRDANFARARDIAFAGIPRVMSDVVADSSNTLIPCPRCDGLGTLDPGPNYDEMEGKKRKKTALRTCPECEGIGKVKKSGDIESRKLLFETTGMTGKKAPMVAIQNNVYGPSSLESFVDNFDKLDSANALPMIEGETEPVNG